MKERERENVLKACNLYERNSIFFFETWGLFKDGRSCSPILWLKKVRWTKNFRLNVKSWWVLVIRLQQKKFKIKLAFCQISKQRGKTIKCLRKVSILCAEYQLKNIHSTTRKLSQILHKIVYFLFLELVQKYFLR